MRGLPLKTCYQMLGLDGIKTWFNWSFVDPIKHFIWLNITHKPYCTHCGWHCPPEKYGKCEHPKLLTKGEILNRWADNKKELEHVEVGENGGCPYCGEEPGEIEIPNPNMDKLDKWLVCIDCSNVIENQQKLGMGELIGNNKMMQKANDKLNEIAKKTGKPILNATIDTKTLEVSSMEFTGEKDG